VRIRTTHLGHVSVTITPTKNDGSYEVRCHEGDTVSTFTASEYELTYYRRHMNTKITQAFKAHRESTSHFEGGQNHNESADS
jgi:hypothetical protein